jgi:hypothetical protein
MCRKHGQLMHMWEEGDTAYDHCHEDENKRPLSLILKWLYTALNIKMETNSETKKLQVTFTLQVNLADHGYVLAHTYTCHMYLFA